jgi:hypothetical protein
VATDLKSKGGECIPVRFTIDLIRAAEVRSDGYGLWWKDTPSAREFCI